MEVAEELFDTIIPDGKDDKDLSNSEFDASVRKQLSARVYGLHPVRIMEVANPSSL